MSDENQLMPTPLIISRLPKRKRHVSILDHMLDLSPHYNTNRHQQGPQNLAIFLSNLRVHSWFRLYILQNQGYRMHILVKLNNIMKYTTNTGQNTGTLNISNQVARKAKTIARVELCQNLNSGKRRMKGRNSSSALVGRALEPSSRPSSWEREGSNLGWRKARNWFRR